MTLISSPLTAFHTLGNDGQLGLSWGRISMHSLPLACFSYNFFFFTFLLHIWDNNDVYIHSFPILHVPYHWT